jgi:ArpU family phage transcriptional regulator
MYNVIVPHFTSFTSKVQHIHIYVIDIQGSCTYNQVTNHKKHKKLIHREEGMRGLFMETVKSYQDFTCPTQVPELDKKATRKKVEEALETVRLYRQVGFVRRETRITSTYNPRYHGVTNAVGIPAEEVALWNVEREEEMRHKAERVEQALSRMWKKERGILEQRFLAEEPTPDFLLCHELNLSERTYRRIKGEAMQKLGIMLELAVYTLPGLPQVESERGRFN